jgi:DNA-binding response OmpR family regulator
MSRVLVVDDEQHIAEGVRFNLQADGHDVVVAETGEQALDLLLRDRSPFDVVVLDVMLPPRMDLRLRPSCARRAITFRS